MKYSIEVQEEFLRLYRSGGVSIPAAASSVGISQTLARELAGQDDIIPCIVPVYRCPGCGGKNELYPCIACRTRASA